MAGKYQYQADIKRIAHILNVEECELGYLNALSGQDRRALYHQVEASISGEQSALWPALAKSVRFFPNRLCAKITQEAFGPYIAAQMTSHLDTKTAIGIGKYFTAQFLAEVLLHVDVAKAGSLLAKWPLAHLKKVVLFLLAEQQFEQMGGIVEHLPKDRILEVVKTIDSPLAVMQTSHAVQHKMHLAEALIQLKDEELQALIEATNESGLWEAALLTCSHLNAKQQLRVRKLSQDFEWDDERVFHRVAEQLGIADELSGLLGAQQPETSLAKLSRFLGGRRKTV